MENVLKNQMQPNSLGFGNQVLNIPYIYGNLGG